MVHMMIFADWWWWRWSLIDMRISSASFEDNRGRKIIDQEICTTGLSLHNLTNWEEACLGVHVLPFNHNHLRPDSDQKMTRKRNFRGQHLSFPGAPPECPLCHCHAFYISWFYFLNSKLDFSRSKWFWWFRLTSVAPLTISGKEVLKHGKYFSKYF